MSMTKAAVLTGERTFEMREFSIPEVKEDEILVQVEGCGICGTDVHEYKGDPFHYIPVVLGHEGTGTIIAMGKNVKEDTQGRPVSIGDKIVSSVLVCGHCGECMLHPDKPNLCDNLGVYGLIPDSEEYHLNGWFADHILLRKGSTFFVVNELSLDERMLLEPAAVTVHALERAKTTNLLSFNSYVLVQGCGPIGLFQIAVLNAHGISNIIALDGNEQRLETARKMGAKYTINFNDYTGLEEKVAAVKKIANGLGVDFAFQCTGNPQAASEVFSYIRRGGGMCELGFFTNNGSATFNPHLDLCNKEITIVGSWVYSAQEYLTTIDFFKRAAQMNIPITELITHKFPLEEIKEAMETNLSMKGLKIAIVNQ